MARPSIPRISLDVLVFFDAVFEKFKNVILAGSLKAWPKRNLYPHFLHSPASSGLSVPQLGHNMRIPSFYHRRPVISGLSHDFDFSTCL